MNLLILTGKRKSGKDTVCKILQKLLPKHNFRRLAFADPLKEEVATMLGITVEQLEKIKNEPLFRKLLQDVGVDKRKQNPTYWIDKLKEKIDTKNNYIITDCRFLNEAEEMKKYDDGKNLVTILRVERKQETKTNEDLHISETELEGIRTDFTIYNMNTLHWLEHIELKHVKDFLETTKRV